MITIDANFGTVRVSTQEPGAPGVVVLRLNNAAHHEMWVALDGRDALVLGQALITYGAGNP